MSAFGESVVEQSALAPLRILATVAALLMPCAADAELRGHGGPVRALAIGPDGALVASGSFDGSAILWSLRRAHALQVLRFHDDAVNAVAFIDASRLATGGADGRIAIWRLGAATPDAVLTGHEGPIASLATSPDGRFLASGSWDRSVRLWSLENSSMRVLALHRDNVNAVAFTPDGGSVVSAGYDSMLLLQPLDPNAAALSVMLPAPLNTVVVAPDGEIVAGGADGRLRMLASDGTLRGEMEIEGGVTPITALALSRDGWLLAAGGLRGAVVIVDRVARHALARLVGPGMPVWSLAFAPQGSMLYSGGADRVIREWNARSGEPAQPPLADPALTARADPGARGAQVFRACEACHAIGPDEGNRAGPTLHGIFGRRIATLPGYRFSEALTRMDIVWNAETIARLFEIGPLAYTPGTKMPEQLITDPDERAALIEWLARVTRSP